MNRLMEERGIAQEDISYPLAIIGERCLIGYTQIREELYDSLSWLLKKEAAEAESGKTAGYGRKRKGKQP